MIETLERLILQISARIETVPELGEDDWRDSAKWQARQHAFRAIVNDLVVNERARYRAGVADAYVLVLAGIRSSCTSSEHGLLTNWVGAAKRKIQESKQESKAVAA